MHQGSAADKAILKKLNQHLARISLGAHSRVTATVRNGQVTLSGTLQYENQRRPAMKAATSVDGVRGVLDQLHVPPRQPYGPPSKPLVIHPDASRPDPPQPETPIPTRRSPALDHPEANDPAPLTGVSPSGAESRPAGPSPPAQVEVDDLKAVTCYANFCRVTGTPEELLIDFGLVSRPPGAPTEAVAVTQRIVTNLYTAKRLAYALQLTLQRHEAVFGVIETDVGKRAQQT
jgi:hypothetical protein